MDEYDLDLEELHDDDSFAKPKKPAAVKKNIEVKAPKEAAKPVSSGSASRSTQESSGTKREDNDSRLEGSASTSSFSSKSSLKASSDLNAGSSYQPSLASGRVGKAEAVSSSAGPKKASPFPWDTADDDQVTSITPAAPSAVSSGGYEPSSNKRLQQGGLSSSTSTSSSGYQPSFARQPASSAASTSTTQAPSGATTEAISAGGGGYEPSLFGASRARGRGQNTGSAGGYEPSFGKSETPSQASLSNSASSASIGDTKAAPASSSGYESNLFGHKAAPPSNTTGYEPSFARPTVTPQPPTPSTPTPAYEPNLFGKKSSAFLQPTPAPSQPPSAATGGYEPSVARPTAPLASTDVAPAPSGRYEPSLFGGKKKEAQAPVSTPSTGYEPSLFGGKKTAGLSSAPQPTSQPTPAPQQQSSGYEPSLFGGKKATGAEGAGGGKGGGGYEPSLFGGKKTAGTQEAATGAGAGAGGYEASLFGGKKTAASAAGGEVGSKGQGQGGGAEPSLVGARKEAAVAGGGGEGAGGMTATARARADKVVVYAPEHQYMLQEGGGDAGARRRLWEGLGEEERGELEMLEGRNAALQAQVRACRERLRHALGQSGTAGPVSTVARLHLNRFSSLTVLDGQLANAQRRIEGYQRDNDSIRRRVESLGDRSMLERLEGKVRWKEGRLLQLGEERKALLLLRRNYEKQLMYDDHLREHWPETVASIQKDVRVCQWKLRRLKHSIEALRDKERDQQAQIAALAGQNRELLERASLSGDMVDDEVMGDPTKLLGRKRRRRQDRAKEVEKEKKKLQDQVSSLQQELRRGKAEAESGLRALRREEGTTLAETTRLAAVLELKQKEGRLLLLQTKILRRTLRDLVSGTVQVRDARAILTHVRSEADAKEVVPPVGRSKTGLLPSFMMPTRPPTDAPEDEKITPRSRRNYARLRNSVSSASSHRHSYCSAAGDAPGMQHKDPQHEDEEDEDMASFITAAMELEGHRERHVETAAPALRHAEERQDAQRRASRTSAPRRSNASDSSSRHSLIALQQQHAQADQKPGSHASSAASLHSQPTKVGQPKGLPQEEGGRAEGPWQPRPTPQAPANHAAVPDYTSRGYGNLLDDRSAPMSPTSLRQQPSPAQQHSWQADVPQASWRPAQQDQASRDNQAPVVQRTNSYKTSHASTSSSKGGTVRGGGMSDEAAGESSMARQGGRAKEEGGYDEDFDNDFEDDFDEEVD